MIPVVDNLELVKKEEEFMEKREGEFKIYKFNITKNPTVPQDGFLEVKEFEELLETTKKEVKK